MVKLIRIRTGLVKSVFALEVNGRCETYELLQSLPGRAERRLDYIFERLAETGWTGKGTENVRCLRRQVMSSKNTRQTSDCTASSTGVAWWSALTAA